MPRRNYCDVTVPCPATTASDTCGDSIEVTMTPGGVFTAPPNCPSCGQTFTASDQTVMRDRTEDVIEQLIGGVGARTV